MRSLLTAILMGLGLSACTMMPDLPDPKPADDVVRIETKDWENWGKDISVDEEMASRQDAIGGRRLSAAQITQTFGGRVLRGCYPNGEKFAELLENDGQFYDVMNNNKRQGEWRVTSDHYLCFRYPERAQQGRDDSCFIVIRQATGFDFYSLDLMSKQASTMCGQ